MIAKTHSLLSRPGLAIALALIATLWLAPTFSAQQPAECFVLARLGDAKPSISNLAECERKTAPASTFKVPHALIALHTGVIDADTVFKWDGTAYDFESWQRDHTLASAIVWSVYPVFQRTARSIGPERMRKELASLGYASDTFDGDVATFWNNGDLQISPLEQIAFLQRLFAGTLPIPSQHLATVKAAIRMQPGQVMSAAGVHEFALTWPAPTVYAKTGNTSVNGERVSWLLGSVHATGRDYVFAARVRSTGSVDRTAGLALAARELNRRPPVQ